MYLQGPFASLLVTQTYIDLEIKTNNATLCTMMRRFRKRGRRYATSNLKAWNMWCVESVHFCTALTCTKFGAFGREARLSRMRLLPPAYARYHRLCRLHSIMALWLAVDEKIAFEILEFQKSQFSIKRLLPQSSFHIDRSQTALNIALNTWLQTRHAVETERGLVLTRQTFKWTYFSKPPLLVQFSWYGYLGKAPSRSTSKHVSVFHAC